MTTGVNESECRHASGRSRTQAPGRRGGAGGRVTQWQPSHGDLAGPGLTVTQAMHSGKRIRPNPSPMIPSGHVISRPLKLNFKLLVFRTGTRTSLVVSSSTRR